MDRINDKRPRMYYVYSSMHGNWDTDVRDFSLPERLTAFGIAVYSSLCAAAGARNACDPSVPTLAKMSGCSEKKVREALSTLQELGMITIRARRSGELNDTNEYTITEWVGGVVPTGNQVVPHGNPNDSSSRLEDAPEKLNCAVLYEQAFGWLPSLHILEMMNDLAEEYGEVALTNAMKAAAAAGKREIRYVQGILRNVRAGDNREPKQPEPVEQPRGRW